MYLSDDCSCHCHVLVSPDAIVYGIGSSATLGNESNSQETGGAYIIPSAMMTKDGYILAWELFASKLGPIRLQVRP